MRFWVASVFTIVGHWFLDRASQIDVDAFEMNFDGSSPFGRERRP